MCEYTGRSVKWLKKIEISDKESQHHLHFWVRPPFSHDLCTSALTQPFSSDTQDNKVLPGTLTAEQARNERDWWYDPK
jgi:nitrate reductase (NAD(P)H)